MIVDFWLGKRWRLGYLDIVTRHWHFHGVSLLLDDVVGVCVRFLSNTRL